MTEPNLKLVEYLNACEESTDWAATLLSDIKAAASRLTRDEFLAVKSTTSLAALCALSGQFRASFMEDTDMVEFDRIIRKTSEKYHSVTAREPIGIQLCRALRNAQSIGEPPF